MGGQAPAAGRVWEKFQRQPWRYDFWRALALCRKLRPRRRVRFALRPTLSFSPAAVSGLKFSPDDEPTLAVNLSGLTGPEAPLPPRVTELAESLARRGDPALADFWGLFGSRVLDLYQEQMGCLKPEADPDGHALDSYLLAAAGMLGEHLRGRKLAVPCSGPQGEQWGALPEASFLSAAQVWGLFPRSASGLEFLVEKVFGVRAKVEPLRGAWTQLPTEHRSRLGRAKNQLGCDALSGGHIFDPAAGFTLKLGPLTKEQHRSFLPPPAGNKRGDLMALVKWYLGTAAISCSLSLNC
ncbi:MAG: type VI secretion system baseplate subunit TssG [Candidatus Adiutrix sp.]|jgi:type VI secretion system protein ImpH|nr:type VI secretion system baseplate subunit TssG [Candidatus Adiutrix sp.]